MNTVAIGRTAMFPGQGILIPSKPEETEEQVIIVVKSLAAAHITAINNRQFDPELPPWNAMVMDFQFVGIGSLRRLKGKTAFLQGFQKYSLQNPGWTIDILNMQTVVYLDQKYAEVMLNSQSTGGETASEGVRWQTVATFGFRKMKGKWMAVSETIIPGLDNIVA